jgi:hypothetical protein
MPEMLTIGFAVGITGHCYTVENPRLPKGQCVDFIRQLPEKEIRSISAHIGMDADPEALVTAMDRSMSAFYAVRSRWVTGV